MNCGNHRDAVQMLPPGFVLSERTGAVRSYVVTTPFGTEIKSGRRRVVVEAARWLWETR